MKNIYKKKGIELAHLIFNTPPERISGFTDILLKTMIDELELLIAKDKEEKE